MTSQGCLFAAPPPPDCDEERAVAMLKSAFAMALLEAGTATLSDARRHLPDPRITDCIRPCRFGSIPSELGGLIESVTVGRANHARSGNHFCLTYRPRDRAALQAIAEGGSHV